MKSTMSYYRAAELRQLIGSNNSILTGIRPANTTETAEIANTWAKTSGVAYREALCAISRKGGCTISSSRIAEILLARAPKVRFQGVYVEPATDEENVEIMSIWSKISSPICFFTAISNIFLDAKDALVGE